MADTFPLSLAAAKLHLRVDGAAEDGLITDAIRAAAAWIEDYTVLVLTPRTITETFDSFGGRIELRSWPVRSITRIDYVDRVGGAGSLTTGAWLATLSARPVRAYPASGVMWPTAAAISGAVSVTVEAGFADPAEIPAHVLHALKLMVTHFYTNRTPVVTGASAAVVSVPLTVKDLLREWRRRRL